MSAVTRGVGIAPCHRRALQPWRILMLALLATTTCALAFAPRAEARGAGAGRMATASVGAANRAAAGAPARPAQLPATPGAGQPATRDDRGSGWYYGYAYGSYGDDDERPADDHAIDVERAAATAAAATAAAAAAAAAAAPPAAGTVVYALEPGCGTVERNGKFLRYCGGVYYQEQFAGDRVAYRVVDP